MGVGKNIKRILAEKKMTIKELHQASGIPLNTLYSITKRDSDGVSSSVLTSIAKVLNVSPFDLTVDVAQLRSDVKLTEDIQQVFGSEALELLSDFDSLNLDGRTKACEYVSDLSINPKYKKEPPSDKTESGSDWNQNQQ